MSWDFSRFWKTLTYYDALPFAETWRWLQQGFQPHSSGQEPAISGLTGTQPTPALLLGKGLPTGLAEALRQQGIPVWDSPEDGSQLLPTATVFLGLQDEELATAYLQQIHRSGQTEQMLFDFRQPHGDLGKFWGILDDVVMGGVSQSQLRWGEGQLLFTGQVSTANGGGFVSTRTRNWDPPLDWSAFAGLELRLRGDGQRYKFFLRDQRGWDSPAYAYAFDTQAAAEETVRIPFAEMVATFRARLLPNAPPLNTRCIYSLQLMLSKFEADGSLNPRFRPGSFQLGLRWIGAYRRDPLPKLIAVGRGGIPDSLLRQLQTASNRWCGLETTADREDPVLVAHLLRLMQSPQAVGHLERL